MIFFPQRPLFVPWKLILPPVGVQDLDVFCFHSMYISILTLHPAFQAQLISHWSQQHTYPQRSRTFPHTHITKMVSTCITHCCGLCLLHPQTGLLLLCIHPKDLVFGFAAKSYVPAEI